ncbi:MAG: peptidyl-prolyl cis-trans isomerase [Ignavibacterium album]|uniref:peptidylprolyl isomerase n=1 Tax=Ignavibacterium album TaxID=591197 RepID=UPI0026EDCAD6|nr:peptidyl-prolyl cis-trans isomerase [Ignavibacterium album]MCX8104587.1 peptidyl-prolyl cis-trans isomerase [Ignavibacterium album]
MKLKLILFATFIILIQSESITQSLNQPYVARVGSKLVSDSEFLERYELTPGFKRHIKQNDDSNKLEFLFTLIAEKLFALEAKNLRLDTTEVIQFSRKAFERMFVRDKLFQEEIRKKISVSEKELMEATIKNNSKLYVNFLFSEDKNEIEQLYNYLKQGIPFDSILVESPEYEEQKEPIEVLFGQMDETIEDSLYKLKVGQFTKPMLTPDGWYIFKLVNKSQNFFLTDEDKDNAKKTVARVVENRKLIKRQKEFYAEYFRNKKVDVDPQLFELLAQKISAIFEYKRKNFTYKENQPTYLDAYDVMKIENEIGEEKLSAPFVQFDYEPIIFKEFIRTLAFDGFNSKEFKINYIRASLDFQTKRFIEHELFYREGLKRGYNKLPEVQNEVERWLDNYLFQMLQNQIVDSIQVSDEELRDYYEMMNQPKEFPTVVNIIEVLTDDLSIVDTVLNELKKGTDIRLLAAKYSIRDFTKGRNGEFGKFPVTSYGEIGKIAATMQVGDIYGPLKVPDGYSIFKLIEKDTAYVEKPKTFEQVKEQYRQDLAFKKAQMKLNDYTYNLALKYNVELNIPELDKIQVTRLPSFGIRNLGFGGKITAVPILAPNVEWAYRWIQQQNKKVIP